MTVTTRSQKKQNVTKRKGSNEDKLCPPDGDSERYSPSSSLGTHVPILPMEEKRPLREEMPAIILLVVLYTLQGIPLGLCLGSIPFLLQSHTTKYTELGIFSLAAWPYSLKLLWSPIVDTYYIKAIGRRKSWILPTQCIIGISFIMIAYIIDELLEKVAIVTITTLFFFIIIATATQDIAVDGWALTMLSKGNVVYASTSQSIGQNIGFFLSYSIFLALNNPNFSNHFRSIPSDLPLVSLSGYLFFWGLMFLIVTAYLAFLKHEEAYIPDPEHDPSLRAMYMRMWRLLQLPSIQSLCLILLTCRVAFICNDSITILKLTEQGFPKENMAIMVFIAFPFELVFPVIVGRWSNSGPVLRPYIVGYPFRVCLSVFAILVVYMYPSDGPGLGFYSLVLITQLIYSLGSNLMFVSQCGFFSRISDDSYGGTYMTLLNTISNLGSTWPKFIIYWAVDQFTCKKKEDVIPNCSFLPLGTDGYYIVSAICFVCGIIWYTIFRSRLERIQHIEKQEWTIKNSEL